MSNTNHEVNERAHGAAHALSLAVVALILEHPNPGAVKDRLSALCSDAEGPDGPLQNLSDSGKKGWYSIVTILQAALGGFPIMKEVRAGVGSRPESSEPSE